MKTILDYCVNTGECPVCLIAALDAATLDITTMNIQQIKTQITIPAGITPFAHNGSWFYCCESHSDPSEDFADCELIDDDPKQKISYESLFKAWIEENLALKTRDNDNNMANLYTIFEDYCIATNCNNRSDMIEKLEELSNQICGTTF